MWRLFKLGYHHEPRLLVTAFVLSLLAAVPDALIALWLALLGKGAVEGNDTLVHGGRDRARRLGHADLAAAGHLHRGSSGGSATG